MAGLFFAVTAFDLGAPDYDVLRFISDINHGGVVNQFFTYFTLTGGFAFMLLTVIALYVAGARKEALVFAIVLGLTTITTVGLKGITARTRPNGLTPHPEYASSFPSGHAAYAFGLATTISAYHRRFSLLMFAWAVLVGFSRLYLGVHYLTDVLVGALIGTGISFIVTRAAKRVDDEISRIASTEPLSDWRDLRKLPRVFVKQLALVIHAIIEPNQTND
jgi:undecaprenyl-diphosphatase